MAVLRRAVTGAAVLLAAGVVLRAGQDAPPVFRAAADLVQVDVTVLDRQRQPVRGLTADDFTVLIDGEPRAIQTFAAVDLAERTAAGASWMHEVPADVADNRLAGEEGRLVVILMDRSIPVGQPTLVARDAALAIVDELGPGDMAALVSTSGGVPQNFTADRTRLRRAITQRDWSSGVSMEAAEIDEGVHEPGLFTNLTDPRCLCGLCQPHTITRVAEALEDLPRRRKSIVFIGTSFTFQAGPMLQQVELGCGQKLEDARKKMFEAIDRSGVTVHAIDPGGLRVVGPVSQAASTARGGPGPRGAAARQVQAVGTELQQTGELHVLPDRTGGRVVMNTNAPQARVPEIIRESQSYYLLGFEPDDDDEPGRVRSIEVRVNRRGVTVQARRRFVVGGGPADDGAARALVDGLLPSAERPMDLSVAAFAAADGSRVAHLAIAAGVHGLAPPAGDEPVVEPLEVVASAYDPTGRPVASARQTLEVEWPAAGLESPSRVDVLSRLDLPPNDYELRVAATAGGDRQASVFTHVTIPPFAGAKLSLSHVALSAGPTVRSAPPDFLADVVPIRPTPQRHFRRAEGAAAFVRVYQGTALDAPLVPVGVRVRIVDSRDVVVSDEALVLQPEAFAEGRATELRLALPVAVLPPGEYLLRLEAGTDDGEIVGRAVRFAVD